MIGDIMINCSGKKEHLTKMFIGNDSQRNEQSFDVSQIEMRRTCKYKPPLNISNLPSAFEMPKTNYNSIGGYYNLNANSNNQCNYKNDNPPMQYSRGNLQPIKHIRANIKIINDNPIEKGQVTKKPLRPQLKPIELKYTKKNNNQNNNNNRSNYQNNSDKELLLALANKHFRFKSLEKFSKTSEYYYHLLQKMEPEQSKMEMKRLEKCLNEQDHTSLNKSAMNEANIITQHKASPNKINIKTVYNALDYSNQQMEKYAYCVDEFVSISSTNEKVLHIPSLQIFFMQKIAKDSRDDLINDWETLDHSVLKVVAVFKNHPNKHDTIVTEMAPNGSIDNLIKTTGAINERLQRGLIIQLLPLIEYYNIRIGKYYDFIKTTNICFDNRLNIILHPSFSNEKKELRIISEMKERWSKVVRISKSRLHMKMDLFALGIMLFDINLGIIDTKTKSYLKSISEEDYKGIDSYCCLYHFLAKIIPEFASIINNKLFSEEYLEFLCHITSFELNSLFSMNKIKKEAWIKKKHSNAVPLYNLKNVVHTAKVYDFANQYYTSNSQIRNFDILCENIRDNLPFCEEYFKFHSIFNSTAVFNNNDICYDVLARELRIDVNTLKTRLEPLYSSYFDKM